jgi:hypothetical protein
MPNARDGHNPSSPASERTERKIQEGWTIDLNEQAAWWQTPAVDSFRSRSGNRKEEMGLDQQARFWPTRTSSPPDPPIPAGPPFCERVRILLRLCRQLKRQLPSPYSKTRSIFRPKLNPDFVDWLQGLPPGYTSEGFDSSAMETWLSRCRRRCASLCSPEGWGF